MVLLIGSLLVQVIQRRQRNISIAAQKQSLPDFTFYKTDGTPVSSEELSPDNAVCLIYLDPDCHFCKKEVEDIIRHIDAFGQTRLLLISHVDSERLEQFIAEYRLDEYEQITVLQDRDFRFADLFGNIVTPSVYIYGADKILRKEYSGQTKVAAITQWL